VGIGDLPEGRALYQALEREAASTPVRAMSSNPRDAALVPGVSAMSIPPSQPDSLLAAADSYRITHAVLGSLGVDTSADRVLLETLHQHPERFRRVFGNDKFTCSGWCPHRRASSAYGRPALGTGRVRARLGKRRRISLLQS
jgi:hypothetical protein